MSIFKSHKSFDEIVPDFLAERKIVLKERTYIGYIGRLNRFSSWLKTESLSETPLNKLTNQNLGRFFACLANDYDLDKPTCQKYAITLKKVWEYAVKIKECDKKNMPFDLVVFPGKKGDFSPELIPKDKFISLTQDMKENDPQLYVAAMIQYYSFIRPRGELRNLKTNDINLAQGSIKISEQIAKTKITRFATITRDLYDILVWYGLDTAPAGKFVFGKKQKYGDKPVGINSFSYRFNEFREKHELSKGVKFYSFKHSGMTDMLNSGVPLPAVQGQAGHLRLSSTQHYVKKYGGVINQDLLNYKRN